MLDYVYAAMWFAAALLLFFRFGKMNKIFYFAGALFLVMGGWWLAGAILQRAGLGVPRGDGGCLSASVYGVLPGTEEKRRAVRLAAMPKKRLRL